tara:strand:- start:57 stop:476 length:420 start_codon:yes stop_codon:yes gene_type:complete
MKLDLDIGDIILTGRFKNKPVEVKEFGTDEKGQPTINGRPILKFRIKKLIPENTKMDKKRLQQIIKEEVSNVLNERAPKMKVYSWEKNFKEGLKNLDVAANMMKMKSPEGYRKIKKDLGKVQKALMILHSQMKINSTEF